MYHFFQNGVDPDQLASDEIFSLDIFAIVIAVYFVKLCHKYIYIC